MTLLADPSLAALVDVARGLVFVLFVLCAVLLMIVVLIQEGKGGGLGSAFGGAAADAFGVKAGTVSRFTTWLAMGFLSLALLHAGLSSAGKQDSMVPTAPTSGTQPSADPVVLPGDTTPPNDATPPGDTTPPDDATPPGDTTPPDDATPPGDTTPPDDATPPGDTTPPDGTTPPDDGAPPDDTTPPDDDMGDGSGD